MFRIQDKGSRLVIMWKDQYHRKMLNYLEDISIFKEELENPSERNKGRVNEWARAWNLRENIGEEEYEWITLSGLRPGKTYANIKTHKGGWPYRFIISGIGTPIGNLACWIEFHPKGFDQAKNTSRSNAILSKSRTNDTKRNLFLVMDYHPYLKDLPKLIKNHLPTLYGSPLMRKVFSDERVQIRTGFRRTKNLKDLLVPSSLPVADQETSINSGIIGCYRCHRQVCDACQNFLVPAKRIRSVTTGKRYKIRQSLSCRTDYVIYCATCRLCNRQCVDSSINLRSRLSNHKSHIKENKRTCRLVNHFIDNSCSHTLSDLKFLLIEQVATKTEKFLERREGYWRAQLWTYEPHGFNTRKKEFNSGRRREFLS